MSTATTTGTQTSIPQDPDAHDVIRVQGARANNLQDVSVEIPKRRLTVFTGVSGISTGALHRTIRLPRPRVRSGSRGGLHRLKDR